MAVPHVTATADGGRRATQEEVDARKLWKRAGTPEERKVAGREYRRLRAARWRASAAARALTKPAPTALVAMTRGDGQRTMNRREWDGEREAYARELFAASRGEGGPTREQLRARAGLAAAQAVVQRESVGMAKIGLAEWLQALGGLAGGSRVGTDGVSPLMLRLTPWSVKMRLAELWSGVRPDTYPDQWKHIELVSIAKEAAQAPTAAQ